MDACYHHNVQPCLLPAHTSHGLQPLDNGIFAVLKNALDQEAEKLNILRDRTPLGKINFVRCLIEARKAVTVRTIKHGWKVTRNWPLKRAMNLRHLEIVPDRAEKSAEDPTIPVLVDVDDPVVNRAYS